ncbi:MAG: flagellar hook-length control protein FliK, partial [Oscillospiraceae bacterium]
EQGDKNQGQATADMSQAATPETVKQNSEAETIADAPVTAAAKEQKADGGETNKPLETAAPSGDATVAKATEKTQAANAPAQEASAKDFQAEVKTAQNNTNNDESTKSVAAEDLAEGLKSEVKNSNDKSASGKETLLSSATQQGRADIGVNADSANASQVADARTNNTTQTQQTQSQQFSEQIYNKTGEQINSAIRNSVEAGGSEVTVKLNPPELGSVSIKLQQNQGEITGTLEFSKAETKSEIQQLLPQLVRSLQEAGISVKKLDVVQTQIDNSSQQQQFRENIGQNASAFAQQFGQSNSNASGSASGYEWASADSAYMTDELLSQSYISDQAVNMLV